MGQLRIFAIGRFPQMLSTGWTWDGCWAIFKCQCVDFACLIILLNEEMGIELIDYHINLYHLSIKHI